ncbi:MAG TPA: hypothetical protein VLF60_05415 [Candidatus Saccharimonadales bacterium]|nr:hypothetical protein [Candidatus Saccharimonadales bacterium]
MKKLRTPSLSSIRFKYWLLAVVASAIVVGFGSVAIQQNYRQNANDPQVQYAEDISNALEQGASPDQLGGGSTVDPRKSLGLFLIVTDENKKVQTSTMSLDNNSPVPPDGTFTAAKKGKEQRFTWQPQKDVRVAVVMKHFGGKQSGFIMVARSLTEIEKRETQLMGMSFAAFVALVVVATIGAMIGTRPLKKTTKASAAQGPLEFEDQDESSTEELEPEDEPVPEEDTPAPAAKKSTHRKPKSRNKKAPRS